MLFLFNYVNNLIANLLIYVDPDILYNYLVGAEKVGIGAVLRQWTEDVLCTSR